MPVLDRRLAHEQRQDCKGGLQNMPLSEQIIPGERGKIIGTRVLPPPSGQGPKMEITFQSTGTILSEAFNNTGTVVSIPKSEGALSGEGQAVVMTGEGGMATWIFQGVVKPTGPGMAADFSGIVIFQTSSLKLAPLNSMCMVVSAGVDGDGNMINGRCRRWLPSTFGPLSPVRAGRQRDHHLRQPNGLG